MFPGEGGASSVHLIMRVAVRTTQPRLLYRAVHQGDVHHLPLTWPRCGSLLQGGSIRCRPGSRGGNRDAAMESTGQRQNGSGCVTLNFGYNSSCFNTKLS